MSGLLDSLLSGCASLFCLSERRGSLPLSAKVHAPLSRRPALCKKPVRLTLDDRLRALIGDMITEEDLARRLTFGRVLGTGATSTVYEALDAATGRRVSVKVFDKASMVDARRSMVADGQYVPEKAVHRVRRRLLKLVSELEISKSLDHPNIVKWLGAFETSHRICIVHELVEGSDLLEHLLEHGKMAEDQAARVFRQLLSALAYCHRRNVFHRDLKLENVMITRDLDVKLIDFGLSEAVADAQQTLKTACGTPLYCSPEILFLHSSVDITRKGFHGGPADVWGVGVMIFALLTGCAPFDDSDFERLRREVSRNCIKYPTHISSQAKWLLKRVLVADAQMRPTVTDLLSYGWFQGSVPSDIAIAAVISHKEQRSAEITSDSLCTDDTAELDVDTRCGMVSCRRISASAGTCSSSESL